ncbi:MAG: hypothetical protein A2341_19730 [Deltaproteobacteria bacterium RIFOXYB12_FULL_58_9]|nr:MAG: hypothetical protein A2341_19730 [Deltaproteobacteria bacterium RIFOXYB12_FULL_58_9]
MPQTQLDKLSEKIAKADSAAARAAQKAKSLKAQANLLKRKEDTKKKILYGAAVMKLFEDDSSLQARLDTFMPKFLTRDSDRAVFGLLPLEKTGAQ